MTPSSMLQLLHDPRRRDAAARELLDLLRQLASRMGLENADELVSDAAFSLVRNPRLDVAARGDAKVVGYLRKMLRNGSISRHRKVHRETAEAPPETAPEAPAADPAEVRAALAALHAVYRSLHARRQPRHRGSLETAWKQQEDLLLGVRDMDDILAADEGVTDATSEHDRKKARDRVLQNQHRLRVALQEELQSMESSGTLAPDAAEAARTALGWLPRCHRPRGGGVRDEGGRSS